MPTADLELAFWGRDTSHYAVELRCSMPGSEADVRKGSQHPIALDLAKLRELQIDPDSYGSQLTDSVFSDAGVRTTFLEAVAAAEARPSTTLRLKLSFSTSAAPLHDLRWETLQHPARRAPLASSERILFSRYLESSDWRPVRVIPKADLRALVVIACPSNLGDYALGAIDVAAEEARARKALSGLPVSVLASHGTANLNNIVAELRQGCEILYLVCHGAMVEGAPRLWLENESGQAEVVSGSAFVSRLRELQDLPRFVVLASCQSAGTGSEARTADGGCLAALGPQLAAAGVPAVLAMQGDITMQTEVRFFPKLFEQLMQDGQIDRAMAVARAEVADRPDWWVPVLFTRLKSGRLWYKAGFAGEDDGFDRWPAILQSIRSPHCTPILGPGLVDSYLGSRRQVSEHWAEQYRFPMAPHLREDLHHVAQFLAVHQAVAFPREALNEYMMKEMRRKYAHELAEMSPKATLNELIRKVGQVKREQDPYEPHRVLAQLPLPIYITTNFSSLLTDALIEAGKKPVWDYFRWKQDLVRRPSAYADRVKKDAYIPSPEEPLVYHLFGHFSETDSYVLTEDDYFRYLMGANEHRRQIPPPVLAALANTGLLFLGYQLDDWNFRVLFWTLVAKGARPDKYTHVAAQLDPEEGRIIDPGRARRYLEEYFKQQEIVLRISIYWGTAQHFMRELQEQWNRYQRQQLA